MTHAAARRVLCAALCVCALIALAAVSPTAQQKPEVALKAAIDKEVVEGDLKAAIGMYRTLAASADRAVAAQALLRMGQCYEKLGAAESAEARRAYATVVASFADQPQLAAQAQARLVAMKLDGATSAVAVEPAPTLRQIWPDNQDFDWSRISPDGRFVAGIDNETGDVVTRELASGEVIRLTDIPKSRWWDDYGDGPRWARDGRLIAYAWYEESPSTSVDESANHRSAGRKHENRVARPSI